MSKDFDILTTGTFYWFKSQRRGKVAVPLHHLTDEQKNILRSGLIAQRYELCNPYYSFTAHYMWLDDNRGCFLLVPDVVISSEIKRRLSSRNRVGKRLDYRIILPDIERLLSELKSGEVDEVYVRDFLANVTWKPWIEKEWKPKRDVVIKSSCESCGSQENLVLQHTVQPRKVNSVLYHLVSERYEEFQIYVEQKKNDIELSFPEKTEQVPICPKCGSSRIYLRIRGKNKGTYVCNKSRDYVVCKHKFVSPNYGYSERDIQEAEKRRKAVLRDEFCRENGLLRTAVEVVLKEIIIYLNLTYTKTLCRKCAYMEDKPFNKYH
ncbi:MAG: hypothetical protein AAFN93_19385 [Bacteroidota bacterium]